MPFVTVADLTPRRVESLWPFRLPLRHPILCDGDPGEGKSLITMDLCGRITTGRPFPDGAPAGPPASVIIVNSEDGADDTIYARLVAAGADLSRVKAWKRLPGEPWLRLPDSLRELNDLVGETGAKFIALDPLTAFLKLGVNLGNDQQVRHALMPLLDLAERHACAMEMVRHLNKHGGGRALYRGLHSIAFSAACRLTWFVGADPKVPGQYVLAQPKNNLFPPQPSLAYRIVTTPSGAPKIEWLGASPWRADDLTPGWSRKDREVARAREFINYLLKEGPCPVPVIRQRARESGISRTTLYAARKLAGVHSKVVGTFHNHVYYWLLPGQRLPPHLRVRNESALQEYLQQMEPQFEPDRAA